MKRQKICIIGGGLTGLITAFTLSKLNLNIDLITDNNYRSTKSNRTVAISQNNYDFLKKMNIFKSAKKEFWPCTKMKLYIETKDEKINEIFELNRQKEQIFYMIENSVIMSRLIEKIKKNKLISIKKNKTIFQILSSDFLKSVKFNNKNYCKYNLIIICTGSNSTLVKNTFKDQPISHSYDEMSITTTLSHSSCANTIARQIFLNKEILALLPISKTKTSIVLTIQKKIMKKYNSKKNLNIKNKLKFYTKDFLKRVKFNSNIEYKDLNLVIRKKYYQNRTLLFGDALHVVHPFVGQGFNMVLRDLFSLNKLLKNKINLGLDIGTNDILEELSNKIKPRNFMYSLGIDFIKNFFSFEKKSFQNIRNKILNRLNDNSFAKNLFFNLANRGFRF